MDPPELKEKVTDNSLWEEQANYNRTENTN